MKKILALLLALVMVFALVACGSKPPVTSEPSTTVKTADDIDDNMTSADGKYSLEATRCIGACGLAPVLTVNDEVYGRLTEKDIDGIIAKYKDL